MMDIVSPKPKKDPLRPIPHAMPWKREAIDIAEGKNDTIAVELSGRTQVIVTAHKNSHSRIRFSGNREEFFDAHICVELQEHSSCTIFQEVTGTRDAKSVVTIKLSGEGASCEVKARYHGTREDHHGLYIAMQHLAERTAGDIEIRAVYETDARAVFSGLIKVEKNAQQTKSYFRDDVLLLDRALAESLPTLEIEANDVKASHGSTTSRIHDGQLFYLQSRGLSPLEARQTIIEGFLNF